MEKYDKPKKATYYFSIPNFDGTFNRFGSSVEVIGETEKSYQVILKTPIRNRMVGDKIWVAKKNIKLEELPEIDTSGFWYNKD